MHSIEALVDSLGLVITTTFIPTCGRFCRCQGNLNDNPMFAATHRLLMYVLFST